jgi:RimJ/RimL family protein N-acetyltransferase
MVTGRLRDLRTEDLPRLHAWYQQPELWDHLVGDFVPRGAEEALEYMQRWLRPSAQELRLGIEVDGVGGPRLVGLAFFSPLDLAAERAELHIMIGDPDERGHGVGRQAVSLLVARGFALGLKRIVLRVLASNLAAQKVYAQCGFRVVGRDAPAVKRGRPAEVIVMQIDQPASATT